MKFKEDRIQHQNLSFNSLINQLEDDESLLAHLPENLRMRVLSLPEKYINVTEETLLERIDEDSSTNFRVSGTVEALRNNFWIEWDRVQANRKEKLLNMRNIWQGVGNDRTFDFLPDEAIAYIVCRPADYDAVMAGMQSLAMRRLRDILSIPLHKPNGELNDAKHIELVLKAAAMVDLRNKGSYVSRVETKNMTMIDQRTTSVSHVFNDKYATTQEAITAQNIDEKLKELDEEIKSLPEPASPKFKEAIEVEVVE